MHPTGDRSFQNIILVIVVSLVWLLNFSFTEVNATCLDSHRLSALGSFTRPSECAREVMRPGNASLSHSASFFFHWPSCYVSVFFFLPQQVYYTYCLFYGSIDWGCTCLPSTRRRARGILHSNLTAKHLFISLATQARLKIQDFFGVHRPRICSTTVRVLDLSARGCLILALTSLSLKNIGPAAWSKQSETMISDRQCSGKYIWWVR